ncbi:MAG: hypothetical protein JXB07_05245 [Anaerolineae bacterium]|nr:hypothetical protein [Anaerolineae bacterium]
MKNKIILLRICYWWGIIADGVVAVQMLFPKLYLSFNGIDLVPDIGLRYGLLSGAPLMIGWTLLLLWADRKPLERKGILLLTLPVIVGYIMVEVYAIIAGLGSLEQTLPIFFSQVSMSALFIFSYLTVKSPMPAGQEASSCD